MDWIQDFSLVVHNTDEENAIILIGNREILAEKALLDIIHFYIFAFESLTPNLFLGGQAVALHLESHVTLVDDGYAIFWVVSNNGRNDIEFCVDPCAEGEILEEVAILVELRKTLDHGFIAHFWLRLIYLIVAFLWPLVVWTSCPIIIIGRNRIIISVLRILIIQCLQFAGIEPAWILH